MTVDIKTFDTDDRLDNGWISVASANAGTTITGGTWRANITDGSQMIAKNSVSIGNGAYCEVKGYYGGQIYWGSIRTICWRVGDAENNRNNTIRIETQNYKKGQTYNIGVYKLEGSTSTELYTKSYSSMGVSVTDSIRICMEHKGDKIEFRVYKSSDNSLLASYDCTDSWVISQTFTSIQANCHTTTNYYNYIEEIKTIYDVSGTTFTPKIIMF